MRATEFLIERISSRVFHYTRVTTALKILQSGQFELSHTLGTSWEAQFAPEGYPYFLSTTRTRHGGYHGYLGQDAVLFELDGDFYNQRYPGKAVDYWNNRDPMKDHHKAHEAEDRIFSRENAIPAAIKVIDLYIAPDADEAARARTRQVIILAKKAGIAVNLFNDQAAWRQRDTRRLADVGQLRGQDPARGYVERRRGGYLKPWMELMQAKTKAQLSKNADSKRYDLQYTYDKQGLAKSLAVDLSNARKPGPDADRNNAIRIIQFMRQNRLSTVDDFVNFLADKWKNIKEGVAEAANPVTFAGKDPNLFKSPKGGTPVMVIVTDQGSRYLITSDGMVLRNKSAHANTGGEDAGLQAWSEHIEFYDRSKPLVAGAMQALSFPDAVTYLFDKGRVALSKGQNGERVALILDNNQWRAATIADAMPKAAQSKPDWARIIIKAEAGSWGTQPKLGWQPLDYNQRPDGTLNRVHNGSPVSHGAKVQPGVAEGVMSDLDQDRQDANWDAIVGYVINGLKKNQDVGHMELALYKWGGKELVDVDQELEDRGFRDLADLASHIQQHGGRYQPPTNFGLDEDRRPVYHLPQLVLVLDPHFFDQMGRRELDQGIVDQLLDRLKNITRELQQFEPGQKIWVNSPKLQAKLGMRRQMDRNGKMTYLLKTIVKNPRWDNPDPTITVENFEDGKKPGRKGLAKRVGVDCKQPVSKLRSVAKNSSGERQRMAHWCANMKSGKNK